MSDCPHFRAGVGIVVTNPDGLVLAMKRANVSHAAWQLPQGGIDAGETAETAMWRELQEETGLTPDNCELVAESGQWLTYQLPDAFRTPKVGLGQAQKWFLCRFAGHDADIKPDGREFSDWRWTSMDELTAETIPFRRPVYRAIAAEFAEHLA